jgi:hypothetical protein
MAPSLALRPHYTNHVTHRERSRDQVGIEETVDAGLPKEYDTDLFGEKSAKIFEHVFDAYLGNGISIYEEAA